MLVKKFFIVLSILLAVVVFSYDVYVRHLVQNTISRVITCIEYNNTKDLGKFFSKRMQATAINDTGESIIYKNFSKRVEKVNVYGPIFSKRIVGAKLFFEDHTTGQIDLIYSNGRWKIEQLFFTDIDQQNIGVKHKSKGQSKGQALNKVRVKR